MNKQNKIVWVVIVVAIVVAVLCVGARMHNNNRGYSVVQMTTGELYIGKLKTFPDLELTDAYIYQIAKDTIDPNKANFQLQPVNEMLWATTSMRLTDTNVVFYGPLAPDSKIAQTLADQAGK